MTARFQNEIAATISAFLQEIGLQVTTGSVNDEAFLPGIDVVAGGLIVDESKLLHPGDLLHEAGHLAIVPASTRAKLSGKVETQNANPDVVEAAAICWSYAACLHLEIDPAVVFHEHGYRGLSQNLLLTFGLGVYPGVQLLVSAGMTRASDDDSDRQPYPVMQNWLRD